MVKNPKKIDEKGEALVRTLFAETELFHNTLFGAKEPLLDGIIYFNDKETGTGCTKYISYQLKSQANATTKFHLSKKLIGDITGAPNNGLLFLIAKVTDKQKKLYWYWGDRGEWSKKDITKLKRGEQTIDISKNEITTDNFLLLYDKWLSFAETGASQSRQADKLSEIELVHGIIVQQVVALMFLVRAMSPEKIIKVLQDFLSITEAKAISVIEELVDSEILAKGNNILVLTNKEFGEEMLIKALKEHSFSQKLIEQASIELKNNTILLNNLSRYTKAEGVKDEFFSPIYKVIKQEIKSAKHYQEVREQLKTLSAFSQVDSRTTLEIVKIAIKRLPSLKNKPKAYPIKQEGIIQYILEEILLMIRYSNEYKQVLKLAIQYSRHDDSSVAEKADKILFSVAEPFYHSSTRKIIYGFQAELFTILKSLEWQKNQEVLVKCYSKMLSLRFEFHEYKKPREIVFTSGVLPYAVSLDSNRDELIEYLKTIYQKSKKTDEQIQILKVINTAARHPIGQEITEDKIKEMLAKNIRGILSFYQKIVENKKTDYQVIKEIEQIVSFFGGEQNDELELLKLALERHRDYQKFSPLFSNSWKIIKRKGKAMNYSEANKLLNEKVVTLAKNLKPKDLEDLYKVADGYSKNIDWEFARFRYFCKHIAIHNLSILEELIEADKLRPFYSDFLIGLKENNSSEALGILDVKIKEYLKESPVIIVEYISKNHNDFSLKLFDDCIAALRADDKFNTSLGMLLGVLNANAHRIKEGEWKKRFLDIVARYQVNPDYHWASYVFSQETLNLLTRFSKKDSQVILNSFVEINNLGKNNLQDVIGTIGNKFPEMVVKLFEKRIKYGSNKVWNEDMMTSYRSIPFHFDETLQNSLTNNESLVLPLLLKWFKKKKGLFSYEARLILDNVFYGISASLNKVITELIENEEIDLALSILWSFNGKPSTHKPFQTILKKYGNDKEIRDRIISSLSQSPGIQSGKYGFMHMYKRKKQAVKEWGNLKNKNIKIFLKEYEDYLDRMIESEKNRSDDNDISEDGLFG